MGGVPAHVHKGNAQHDENGQPGIEADHPEVQQDVHQDAVVGVGGTVDGQQQQPGGGDGEEKGDQKGHECLLVYAGTHHTGVTPFCKKMCFHLGCAKK